MVHALGPGKEANMHAMRREFDSYLKVVLTAPLLLLLL